MNAFGLLFIVVGAAILHWLFRDIFGWQFAAGFGIGALLFLCLFRWHYGWWPDFEDDDSPHITR